MLEMKKLDYYEFLQISPNADPDTIHRIYKFLAARYHPDNPATGDPEKFFQLKSAYDVLSDADRRAEYDCGYHRELPERTPLSTTVDFMDRMEGELNRRLAVLAVLYYRRRNNPYAPEVGLAEIEKQMGFPRDYLDFTTWYLLKKGYITRADNSDFTLTAEGVDFVETQRANIPLLNRMLTSGVEEEAAIVEKPSKPAAEDEPATITPLASLAERIDNLASRMVVMPDMTVRPDRRKRTRERRGNARERRAGDNDRRAAN
ncbi:MAG: DnaJ domain-containing protein [Terracidiphilus sp.]